MEEVRLQLRARLGIEGPERFVHQDHRGIVDQRPDQGGAFAHATGQFVWIVALESLEPHRPHELRGTLVRLRRQATLDAKRKEHVLEQRAPGQEGVVLGHVTELPVPAGAEGPRSRARDGSALEADLALGGRVDLGDEVQERRLP